MIFEGRVINGVLEVSVDGKPLSTHREVIASQFSLNWLPAPQSQLAVAILTEVLSKNGTISDINIELVYTWWIPFKKQFLDKYCKSDSWSITDRQIRDWLPNI